ncbi:unnamed protein product [Polarella glacialis]|uniref:J domain-containing protein n=1 Tax=Polarella glacialis TaxID=89957 RepID=A0A813EPC5_POLGL|nr:unnamed protein product [Polarella glacialis]
MTSFRNMHALQSPMPSDEDSTLYALLGVDADALLPDIIQAYRKKAMTEHPDKGGDKDRFDDLNKAYNIISDEKKRAAYDAELEKARERAELVLGGPANNRTFAPNNVSKHQLQGPMKRTDIVEKPREKTAPTAGSIRSRTMGCMQPGHLTFCAQEWKGMGTGLGMLKMLCDDATPEQRVQTLAEKYQALPRGAEMKKKWLRGLRGKERQDLKLVCKEREQKDMVKAMQWFDKPFVPKKVHTPKVAKRAPLGMAKAALSSSATTAETTTAETVAPESVTVELATA